MGTRIDVVVLPDTGQGLPEVPLLFTPLARLCPGKDLVVHAYRVPAGPHPLLWLGFANRHLQDLGIAEDAAQLISRLTAGDVLAVHYSDSAGASGYTVFRGGEAVAASHPEPSPSTDPVLAFREGFELTFPNSGIAFPEDVFDLWDSRLSEMVVLVLARDGVLLDPPEPFSLPPSARPRILGREFEWGRGPRVVVRGLAWAFGGLCGLLILSVLLLFFWEMLKNALH